MTITDVINTQSDSRAEAMSTSTRWSGERIARLGYLLGLGWDAVRIANDPIVSSTPGNIHKQAHRFGLSFRAAIMSFDIPLPSHVEAKYDAAACKRGLTRAQVKKLTLMSAADGNCIDAIIDDGV